MDEAGFHARRRADRENRLAQKDGKLGISHGIPHTRPLLDGEDGDPVQPLPSILPPPAKRRMSPSLSIMCGPMLRYDTVTDNTYHAFAMLVCADSHSVYDPAPTLVLEWDATSGNAAAELEAAAEKLTISSEASDSAASTKAGTAAVNTKTVVGQRVYTYESQEGGQSFWRFKIEVPMQNHEEEIFYSVNNGEELSFWVPAIGENFRWVAHSCNGFSGGVDTESFNGPSPLWRDVLRTHEKTPFHALVGGGDQLYCDPLTKEPEIAEWMGIEDHETKIKAPLTDKISGALDRFFFNHYCNWFRSGAFGTAIRRIPMINSADDHDIIDGWGSYPEDLQTSPVFSTIGSKGYWWFLLFQTFIIDEVDGKTAAPGQHVAKSTIFGGPGKYIPSANRSTLSYLGPKVYLLCLDCRSERTREVICTTTTYDAVFGAIRKLPAEVEHLVVLLGVPIAYPRMNTIETILGGKFSPLALLGKTKALGMGGLVNNFNKEAELLDDLNDHWTAAGHKKERNWLIEQCQILSEATKIRISFLSGDVHAAAISKFYSTKNVAAEVDPKFMLQIISSAIVNTPPPPAVILMVSTLGKKKHKTLHYIDTDEMLLPMFDVDTDGKSLKNNTVLGRRNYATVVQVPETGELEFDIRVEVSQGSGTTKGYSIRTPAPKW